jgi:dienelactone hydrolase
VITGELRAAHRGGGALPYEAWYPAHPRYGGIDLSTWTQDEFTVVPGSPSRRQAAVRDATAAGTPAPIVVFSHTSGGHRRQATHLTTHLASHGYLVAAVDHLGSTALDLVARAQRVAAGIDLTPAELEQRIATLIGHRVPDLIALLAALLADPRLHPDPERIGVVGWSFGGWAALATPERDDRIGAVVAITPAGASRPLPGILPVTLTFGWQAPPPVLLLAAERDRATPVPGIVEILGRVPGPAAMFVLGAAGHGHFGDDVEDEAPCPPEHARIFARSLTLAHLDAALRDSGEGRHFVATEAERALRDLGIAAHRHPG